MYLVGVRHLRYIRVNKGGINMWVNHNENPKKRKASDCVIRAIATATGRSWDEVFMGLSELAFKEKRILNEKATYTKFLTNIGFEKGKIESGRGINRPTVASFARANPRGTYILFCARHLVTIVNGAYYDIFDSGNMSVYTYYKPVGQP